MLPVSFFLFILSYVPLPSSISKTSGISAIVSRLTVIGTVILGLLSGFGSINNAWDYLPILSQNQKYDESFFRRDIDVLIWRRIPADDEVSASERALAKVQQDLADRRADLLRTFMDERTYMASETRYPHNALGNGSQKGPIPWL